MFNWIAAIALKKSLNKGLKVFLGGTGGTLTALQQMGITVQIDKVVLGNALAGALFSLYEFIRNYQKSKGPGAAQLP